MGNNPSSKIKAIASTAFYVATVLLSSAVPLYASAQDAVTETPPPSETTTAPTPPEPSYVFNEATGLWENGTYSWDPATNTTKPLNPTGYSYNPTTGRWETTEWVYDPSTNTYVPPFTPDPNTPATEDPTLNGELPTPPPSETTKQIDSDPIPISGNTRSTIQDNTSQNDKPADTNFFDGFYDASVSVSVNSTATSGNALVVNNTVAGSATSGDAFVEATVVNVLQSSWGVGSSTMPVVHTLTLQGNHVGDIVLDPGYSQMSALHTPQLSVANYSQDVAISNDIDLVATSGDATVNNNTQAGDATSGDAYALANLLNVVQSSIAAQQSFVAILNILGDLEGDVLLPPELQRQLASTGTDTYAVALDDYELNTTNNTSISTVVDAQATSGNANVIGNTQAGSATSGSADTVVTVYNLTGQTIIAENAVLVFVNVLGEWVGFITNAPTGSTSAMLGCCETTNNHLTSIPSETNITQNTTIDNNVNVRAETGDASVTNNTFGGDATSGDALALVNVMNISQSTISLRGWFAVMFINVMGNWHGSFGTDTQYGGLSTSSPIGGEPLPSPTQVNPSATSLTGQNGPVSNSNRNTSSRMVSTTTTPRSSMRTYPTVMNEGSTNQTSSDSPATVLASTDTGGSSGSSNETGTNNQGYNLFFALIAFTSFVVIASRTAIKLQH